MEIMAGAIIGGLAGAFAAAVAHKVNGQAGARPDAAQAVRSFAAVMAVCAATGAGMGYMAEAQGEATPSLVHYEARTDVRPLAVIQREARAALEACLDAAIEGRAARIIRNPQGRTICAPD